LRGGNLSGENGYENGYYVDCITRRRRRRRGNNCHKKKLTARATK